tara:strand:+ start:61 stop:753 length:693 start_codon:yes stop_codon:yes gene_type:complete
MQAIIIAIDGYSSCGKSTLAKALAKRLGYGYLDTGAMYRAITLYGIENQIDFTKLSDQEIDSLIPNIQITFQADSITTENTTFLNGVDVEAEIRGKMVSDLVSEVAQIKSIRKHMIRLQQKAGENKGIVVDGRDIGTQVFPEAELKVFMTANQEVRVQRRFKELQAKGQVISMDEVRENLSKRDYNDTHRKENPLVQAEDAIILDNSNLNQEQQLEFVLEILESKFNLSR